MGYFTTKDNVRIYYEEYGSGDRYVLCTQVGHNKYSLEKELSKRGFHVFLLTNRNRCTGSGRNCEPGPQASPSPRRDWF